MKRQYVGVFGGALLAMSLLFVVVFGPGSFTRFPASTQLWSLVFAGVCFLLAGARPAYAFAGRRLRWYQLYGLGTAVLGVGLVVGNALSPAGFEPIVVGAALVGGLTLCFIGYDIARGGRHFRVDSE